MLKIKSFIKFLFVKVRRSIERFPMPLLFTLGFVIIAIMLNHLDYNHLSRAFYGRLLMALGIGVPITALLKLVLERWPQKHVNVIIIQGLGVILPILYYFTIPKEMTVYFAMRFSALWTLFFMGFLLIPYFYRRLGLSQYILFLAGKFFLTMLYAGVIFGGVSMMIFTIESLFDVNWSSKIYFDLWLMIAGAFGVTHFLGNVPEMNHEMQTDSYSKIFKGLFLYILIPIISIYTLILYAYFVRIIFSLELPEGIIGNLVLWYALVSVFTLFFTQDLKNEITWLDRYFKYYIPAMSIPLLMLFIAIGIRINAYGFTMPRYFVVALALFSVFSLVMMRIKRQDTAVTTMVLLMVFVTLSFFGVLSGYQVTLADQSNRLEKLLVEHKMWAGTGEIIPNTNLNSETQQAISEKVDFLLSHYTQAEIEVLPEAFNRNQFESVFGFKMTLYGYDYDPSIFINYYQNDKTRIMPLNGADYLLSVSRYESFDSVILDKGVKVSKKSDQGSVVFQIEGEPELTVNIDTIASAFYLNQAEQQVEIFLSGKLTLSFIFGNISGKQISSSTPMSPKDLLIDYYDVQILIKLTP